MRGWLLCVVVAVVAAGACGSGGDDDESAGPGGGEVTAPAAGDDGVAVEDMCRDLSEAAVSEVFGSPLTVSDAKVVNGEPAATGETYSPGCR